MRERTAYEAPRSCTLTCLLLAAAIESLLLAGCSGDTLGSGACVTNRECPTGEQCVGGQCVTAAKPGCTGDEACGTGQYCDRASGQCKPIVNCTGDDMCPADQKCNTNTGVCVVGARSCTAEAQCTAINKHCDLAVQLCKDCVDGSHCLATQRCNNGVCEATGPGPNPMTCNNDFSCSPPATVCESMMCVPGCGSAGSPLAPCAQGSTCDTRTGRCVIQQPTCTTDSQCGPPSRICENSQCLPGCGQLGGLACTGGNTCNQATGRCAPPSGCSTDAQCGAPAGVCESNACVPGCGQAGGIRCGAGTVCQTTSGRCVPVMGPCQNDTSCTPPNTICEAGQCVPGCSQVGGVQCTGNTVCNTGTGRCDPGTMVCTTDVQCGAPARVCDAMTGGCVPGCGTAGCTAPQTCNTTTGRCGSGPGPGPGPGTAQLNDPCTANTDCASAVCFDFSDADPTIGKRCIKACGSSTDCPNAYTCYAYNGARMCVSSALFSSATFAQPPGRACTNGGQCKSNFCPNNQCVESCAEDADCGGGRCQWYEFTSGYYTSACNGPLGSAPAGSTCSDDTDCQSGACLENKCAALCSSSASCPAGSACVLADYSTCADPILCLSLRPHIVRACWAPTPPLGTGQFGATCSTYQDCRSGYCDTVSGKCTDTCGTDADCPATHRCKVEQYGQLQDGQNVFFNICLPTGS